MNKIIYIAGVVVMLFAACSNESELSSQQTDSGLCTLQLNTLGYEDGQDNFESGSTFRMALYDDAESDEIYLESTLDDTYNDVYAIKDKDTWKFSFDGNSESASAQFGFQKEPGKTIDIIAVSPYVSDTDITYLYYTPSTTSSYMWAMAEDVDISGDTFTADLNFKPITTAITFKITLKNNTSSVTFTSVVLSVIDESGDAITSRIPYAGRIDCSDGSLISSTYYSTSTNNYYNRVITIGGDCAIRYHYEEDGVTVAYSDYYTEKTIYLYPIEFGKDENGVDNGEKLKIAFNIDAVLIEGTIELGLDDFGGEMMAGNRYSLDIELDNYLRFDGTLTKEDTWIDAEQTIQTDI